MKKLRYSTGMKAAVVVVQQILFVILVISILLVSALFQKNILDFGDVKNRSFESSGYFATLFRESAEDILKFVELRKKFETEGSYSDEKIVDIWKYYNSQEVSDGVHLKGGEGGEADRYYLGDLVEWARDFTTSDYQFLSSFYLNNGIYQKQTIMKDESQVFEEEKVVGSLGEMTLELQQIIVQNIEHYYGGSYSIMHGFTQNSQGQFSQGDNESSKNTEAAAEGDISQKTAQEGAAAQEESREEKAAVLENIIQRIISGELYELNGEELSLLLEDMGVTYADHSEVNNFVNENYLPVNGEGIWDNFIQGNINAAQMKSKYAALEYTLSNIGTEVNTYKKCLNRYNLGKEGSNVYYWIKKDNEEVYTNVPTENTLELSDFGKQMGKYLFYREEDMRLETNVKGMEDIFYNKLEPLYGGKGNVLFLCVDTSFSMEDSFYQAKQEYSHMYPWIYISITSLVISGLGSLICFIYLSMVAGKKGEEEMPAVCWFDRIPAEAAFAGAAFTGISTLMMYGQVLYTFSGEALTGLLIMSGVVAFFSTGLLMLFYLSFIRRIRAGVLWKGSITYWIFSSIFSIFQGRRPLTKMVVWFGIHLLACFCILPLFFSGDEDIETMTVGLFVVISMVEAVLIVREGKQRNQVMEGIRNISEGDLEFKIQISELKGDNRKFAEAVNTIGDGLFHAVDGSMKNERLKADLITNVSHDIKTPLTSIINYVDLMKREDIKNERVQNYLKVLEQKSQRLKQLTEDLVEASKVSSGNITLQMERINFVELVYQTGGEFNEKFEARGLTAITKLPREPMVILADGRRIWRVVENLYNNVAKYAMPNTRVYVDMDADEENVWLSIKNISENALNIQADELTERFIRGDVSRSTEGSGLGLSIAKNLTSLMGGEFEIYLDGDLFKATIRFKREPVEKEQKDLQFTDETSIIR